MYAKIASTQYEDVNEFVAFAIKQMKDRHGVPKEKIASGKTRDGHDYLINVQFLCDLTQREVNGLRALAPTAASPP